MGILNLGGGSGLLGLGGIGGVSSTGALGTMGGLLDPQEMKKQQIKNAMLQAGISLMTNGGIGEAAGAGLLGAQQARDQFVDTAKTAYDFQRTQKQDSRQDAEWEMKLKEQERQEKIRKAQEAWMAAPDDQSLLAQAYPDEVAKAKLKASLGVGDDEYGLNPVWLQNDKGEWMLVQPSKAGNAPRPMTFPEGYRPAPTTRTLDNGLGFDTVPTRGAPVPIGPGIKKNVAGVESEKIVGKGQGEIAFELPKAELAVQSDIQKIDEVIKHKGLDAGTGTWQGSSVGSSIMPLINSDVADFQRRVEQIRGGAFLQAYQTLKGGGAIANAEGTKAEMAIARLNTAVSEKDFKAALNDYKTAIKRGLEAMKAQGAQTNSVQSGGDPEIDSLIQMYGN
jgi:hypothetical protein